MRELGHLAGGYLVTRWLLRQWRFPHSERKGLLLLGTVAGTAPDVDVLLYVLKTRSLEFGSDFDHHQWVTHTFPFYVVPGMLVYLYAKVNKRPKLQRQSVVATVAAVTHLLQDMIGSGTGLMWAWPFSRRMDGIAVLNVTGKAWRRVYSQHPSAWIERALILLVVLSFLFDLAKNRTR